MTPGSSRTQASSSTMRGDFAAGQHVVADRDLFEPRGLDDPLVDALEPAADDDDAGAGRQLAHAACVSGLPRGLISSRGRGSSAGAPRRCAAASTSQRSTMPGPPPAGRVVHGAVAAEAVIADILRLERPEPPRQRIARQRQARAGRETSREKGEDRGAGTHALVLGHRRLARRCEQVVRRATRRRAAAADRHDRHEGLGEGQEGRRRRAVGRRSPGGRRAPKFGHGDDRAENLAARPRPRRPMRSATRELVLVLGRGQPRAGDDRVDAGSGPRRRRASARPSTLATSMSGERRRRLTVTDRDARPLAESGP